MYVNSLLPLHDCLLCLWSASQHHDRVFLFWRC
jgi:hypothetical protein